MRIGWLSTGRDQAAANLLAEVVARAQHDGLPLEIGAVFCDRELGESPESDGFLALAHRLGLPVATHSSAASWATAQQHGFSRLAWRRHFHQEVFELLRPNRLDVLVMAGYMSSSAGALPPVRLLNLHPALPGGPTGTWQEVIWKLLDRDAEETGAMMHLATAQLDRGPVVSFFRFPIAGGQWDPLWEHFREKRRVMSVAQNRRCRRRDRAAVRRGRATRRGAGVPLVYQNWDSSRWASSTRLRERCSPSPRACPSTSRRSWKRI